MGKYGDTSNQAANSTEGQEGGGDGADPGMGSAPPQSATGRQSSWGQSGGQSQQAQQGEQKKDGQEEAGDSEAGDDGTGEVPAGHERVTLTGNWYDRVGDQHFEVGDAVIVDSQTARDLRTAGYAARSEK